MIILSKTPSGGRPRLEYALTLMVIFIFCLVDVANTLEISRSSDLLQIQKGFVKNESPKNRGTLDPKGVVKIYTPANDGAQELAFSND